MKTLQNSREAVYFVVLIILPAVLVTAKSVQLQRQPRSTSCCGKLGCFDLTSAFLDLLKRPINPFPSCDTKISYLLLTQENVGNPEVVDPDNLDTIRASSFRAREGTKILIHGFIHKADHLHWMSVMEAKLLIQGDFNVIRVEWSTGGLLTYFEAAANTRVVGAALADLIHVLTTEFGEDPDRVHLIGHSLGAHIAGYAGKAIRFGRITGLDPAGPSFKDMPPEARLDMRDAGFVDTIITDGRVSRYWHWEKRAAVMMVVAYPAGGGLG